MSNRLVGSKHGKWTHQMLRKGLQIQHIAIWTEAKRRISIIAGMCEGNLHKSNTFSACVHALGMQTRVAIDKRCVLCIVAIGRESAFDTTTICPDERINIVWRGRIESGLFFFERLTSERMWVRIVVSCHLPMRDVIYRRAIETAHIDNKLFGTASKRMYHRRIAPRKRANDA